jgi:uncharacterized protein YukE
MAIQSGLNKHDQDMRTALNALDSHESAMRSAGNTATRIKDEIAANYVAGSSSTFQNRVDDWVTNYSALMNKFQHLREALQGASGAIDGSEDLAVQTGGAWHPGSTSTYSTLMGH